MMSNRRATNSAVSTANYLYLNEDSIPDELKCTICQEPFINPFNGTKCGHTFCESCIDNWFRHNSSCPTCRATTQFVPVTSRAILGQLDRLLVRCRQCNNGNIQRGNLADHIKSQCPHTVVKCKAADLKCQWQGNREQSVQHAAVCPLLQIRPAIEEMRADLAAQAEQLRIFMDEVRDQFNRLERQQQTSSSKQVNINSKGTRVEEMTEQERFNIVNNDLRRTWSRVFCYRYFGNIECNFCKSKSQQGFVCLLCSCSVARQNIRAHDYSGKESDVICRICFDKYQSKMYFNI
ncbi:unnamed protein product [Adineta ricciae]|uniref:RING-type domain-containing protein n=1 Tax=Adineta ricciae TaxID=249248 RepID=A0A815QJ97_ADIRI|nr:unnamed protein product [Adineta ricciae]